mmetsp:Transcript_26162/g.33921  ORF Transcript_26162/g.33921 Transcript_26162/m.33921 type:complete len:348 (-) Transcript_26162:136-1179(-)
MEVHSGGNSPSMEESKTAMRLSCLVYDENAAKDLPNDFNHVDYTRYGQNYCLIAGCGDQLYIAIRGSYNFNDAVCDANILPVSFNYQKDESYNQRLLKSVSAHVWTMLGACEHLACEHQPPVHQASAALAHKGFLLRAIEFPLESILEEYIVRGPYSPEKVIVCGHSLGGAIALLSVARLLHFSPDKFGNQIRAIGVGAPYVGTESLRKVLAETRIASNLFTVVVDGDIVPASLEAGNDFKAQLSDSLFPGEGWGSQLLKFAIINEEKEYVPIGQYMFLHSDECPAYFSSGWLTDLKLIRRMLQRNAIMVNQLPAKSLRLIEGIWNHLQFQYEEFASSASWEIRNLH